MLTTRESTVSCLIEWLAGPGKRVDYRRWSDDLGQRWRTRFTGTARDDQEARRRVDSLISDMQELSHLATLDWSKFKALGSEINLSLARYRYTPLLILDREHELAIKRGASKEAVSIEPVRPKNSGRFYWTNEPYKFKGQLQELRAIDVLELVVRGNQLHMLRRCEECSHWFIARKPWAKLCGASDCRKDAKQKYQTSEDYRKKRRKNPD